MRLHASLVDGAAATNTYIQVIDRGIFSEPDWIVERSPREMLEWFETPDRYKEV